MRDLIAWRRSVPPSGPVHPAPVSGPAALAAIEAGKAKTPAQFLAEDLAAAPIDLGPAHARGRMLARTLCADSHAPGLTGWNTGEAGAPPDLDAASGYDRPGFARLPREGIGGSGKPNGMTVEARKRLPRLTDDGIAALLGYLKARAERSVSAPASGT